MSIIIGMLKKIDNIQDLRSREEHIDRISILKQIPWDRLELYLVNQYLSGKISKGKFAKLLDRDICGVNEVLEKHYLKSTISYERFTKNIEIAKKSNEYFKIYFTSDRVLKT